MNARALVRAGMFSLQLLAWPAVAADAGVVTLAEGGIRLLRGAAVLQATQGTRIQPGDILETDNRGINVVEFTDGLLLGLGPNTRLFMPESGARGKAAEPGQPIVLLSGWLRAEAGKQAPADGYRMLTPALGAAVREAKLVLNTAEQRTSLFLETGAGRLLEPDGAGRSAKGNALAAGQFAARVAAQRAAVQERPAPEFVAAMPRSFRDALPARPALLKADPVAPKIEREARYEDVRDWLALPQSWRAELAKRYAVRLRDPEFRAAALANAARHPEWHPILFPPPRPAEGAMPQH